MRKLYKPTPVTTSKLPIYFTPLIIITIAIGFGIALIENLCTNQTYPIFDTIIKYLN